MAKGRNYVRDKSSSVLSKRIDRGIIIHGTILQHRDSTYGSMAKDLLKRVCLCRGEEITWYYTNTSPPPLKILRETCVVLLHANSSLLDQIRPSAREARSYPTVLHPRNSSLDSSWRKGQSFQAIGQNFCVCFSWRKLGRNEERPQPPSSKYAESLPRPSYRGRYSHCLPYK